MGSSSVSLDELDQQASASANSVSLDELDAQSPAQPHDFTQEALSGKLAPVAGSPKEPTDGYFTNPRTGIRSKMSAVPEADMSMFDPARISTTGPEQIVGGTSDIAEAEKQTRQEPGTFYTNQRTGIKSPVYSLPENARRKEVGGAAEVLGGVGDVSMPLVAATAATAPLKTAGYLGAGAVLSAGAGKAVHGRVSPEDEEFIRNVAQFVPSAMAVMSGLEGTAGRTPGGGRAAGVRAFGGRVGAGIRSTPEAFEGAVKVGDTRIGARVTRTSAPVPEPSEAAKALASFEQHTGNPDFQPAPPPPVPPGANGPEHLTPDVAKGVSDAIMQADPAKRPGLMTEAHGNMVKWMVSRGTFVGPDSKIHTVDSEGQAKKLASKFINDEVDRRDAEQEANNKTPEAATRPTIATPEQPVARAATAAQAPTTTAPIAGKPPAAGHMTTDTAAVKKVAAEANIHPEQQPAIAVKKEPPKETAALAQPPDPVKPEDVARIGKEDKESGRTILQPSDDVMQNERLAAHAAPELATKLSHIAASVEGATFDRLRPQKELERVDEKVDDAGKPPETVPDYLASQIAADSPQAKDQLVAAIKKNFNVIQVEDNFLEGKPELANYRSANLQVSMGNGSTAEIQLVPREQQEIANESHVFYTAGREAGLRGDKAEQEKQYANAAEMHDAAMEKFKQRNGIESPAQQPHSVPLDELEGLQAPTPKPDQAMGNEAPVVPQESRTAPLDELDKIERRQDVATRTRVEHMSPEERAHHLLTDEKTGLPNYRAFHESDATTYPHVGYADLDDFKDFNAALGHTGVDKIVLPRVGEIIKTAAAKEGVQAFHRTGDEFLFRAKDEAAVGRVVEAVNGELTKETFKHGDKEKQGAGLSYGAGKDEAAAEHAASADKERRKRLGLRKGLRDAGTIKPGESGEVNPKDLVFDPQRFQYKLNVNERGVTNLLTGQKWNPDLAGVVSVWRDPQDGKLYVINGHHRAQLAVETGQQSLLVRHLDVPDAASARAVGAMTNIAEGRGTAVDAAKFMREKSITPADLEKHGISMGEATAESGLALSKLDSYLFDKVVTGELSQGRGIAIGKATDNPATQEAVFKLIEKAEKRGRRVTDGMVAELARFASRAKETTTAETSLFGNSYRTENNALDKAEVSDYIRSQIKSERRLFGSVATEEKAAGLAKTGNVIKPEENYKIARAATQAGELYDKLSASRGPIDDILENAAQRISGRENLSAVKSDAYQKVRAELGKVIASTERGGTEGSEGAPGPGRGDEETPAFSLDKDDKPLHSLSKDELRDWAVAAGRRLKIEAMGDQGGLFGGAEKMYRLSTSKQNSVAITQSQLDALTQDVPRIGRMLGMEQPKREGVWFDYDPPEQSNLFSAGKPPVLTISRPARDLINNVGGFRDRFNGANLSTQNARTIAARLAGDMEPHAEIPPEQKADAKRLAEAIRQAADDAGHSGVTLLLDGSPEHVAHEESFHSAQRGLGEGDIRDHLPEEAVNRLLEHPAAKAMGAELKAMGYDDNLHPSYKIAEIAAKIATGQAEDTSDAADWFVKYVDELHQQHGEANVASAFSNLYDGARELYERAKAAKTGTIERPASGSETGLQSPTESLPEHATGPPQESGGIRAKENADGKAYQNKLDQPPLFSLDPKKTITALYKQDIEPAIKGAAGGLKEITQKGLRVIAPRVGVPSHLLDTIMRMKGQREEEMYRFQRTTEGMKKMFDKLPEEARLAFIDRMMHGQRQPSTELEDVADSIRTIQDRFRDQEKVFKPDLTDKENYFHLKWTKLPQGVDEDGNLIEGTGGERPNTGQGNRPLQGGRSFMKRKTLPDASSGIDRGGELLTTNPIGLLEHRVQESLKFTTARKMWEELKDTPYTVSERGRPMHMVQFFREGQGQQARALGYEQLNDRIAKVLFPAGSGEGMVHPGEYWVEQNAARLLNNFLSRDLIRESAAGRGIVGLKNATTAWRLAFSPFHALVESIITTGSEVGRGIEHSFNQGVRQGSPAEAAKGIGIAAKAPVAPFTAAREGGSAIRYVTSPQEFLATTRGQNFISRYPEAAELVSDLFTGGAKLAMHEDFRMKMVESMRQAMADNNYIGAALRTPGALSQAIQYPLFEVYIPRLKLGMFLREYSEALADREPEIEAGKLTRAKLARETWDNIDYRFGEVNWDNFFFNRTFKTSLQLAFRAFAWRFGNFAFTGSGVTGQARQVAESLNFLKDAATGGESARPGTNAIPKIDPRMAKLLGLAIFGLIAHGMLQWALTREKPKDAKDLIAPRDGTLDSHGHPNRWTLPIVPYRDLESAKSNPMGYLRGGTADIWTAIPEAINNRDFRNHLISHPSDPYWEQMFDKAAHVVGVPIGVDRYRQEKKRGEGTGNALLGEAGLSRATNYELTPAEKKMREIQIAHYGPETDEDLEAREKKDERIAAGRLTPKEMQDKVRSSMKNNLERGMKSFTYEQAKQVYDVASPEEKALMGMMLLRKRFNSRRTAAGGE